MTITQYQSKEAAESQLSPQDNQPHTQSMKVAHLTVFDESASCQFLLPDLNNNTFKKLEKGSVLVVHNGATILDSKSRLTLTLASPCNSMISARNISISNDYITLIESNKNKDLSRKYSSVQVYNKQPDQVSEVQDEYGDIVLGFCDDKTEGEIAEILLKNISTIPLHVNR